MTPESENFESLRRLLALKRHEVPPPGYFDRLPREIIARIKAGEAESSAGILANIPWLQRLWGVLEGKPAIVGAFGASVCGLLLAGILHAERAGLAAAGGPAMAENYVFPSSPLDPALASSGAGVPAAMPAMFASTNGGAQTGGSLFDQAGMPSAVPTRFVLPNQ